MMNKHLFLQSIIRFYDLFPEGRIDTEIVTFCNGMPQVSQP